MDKGKGKNFPVPIANVEWNRTLLPTNKNCLFKSLNPRPAEHGRNITTRRMRTKILKILSQSVTIHNNTLKNYIIIVPKNKKEQIIQIDPN